MPQNVKWAKVTFERLLNQNFVCELFANVAIALKIYLCMFVTNCKQERSFFKARINTELLKKLNGQKRLSSLVVLSIESKLLRGIDFSSVSLGKGLMYLHSS